MGKCDIGEITYINTFDRHRTGNRVESRLRSSTTYSQERNLFVIIWPSPRNYKEVKWKKYSIRYSNASHHQCWAAFHCYYWIPFISSIFCPWRRCIGPMWFGVQHYRTAAGQKLFEVINHPFKLRYPVDLATSIFSYHQVSVVAVYFISHYAWMFSRVRETVKGFLSDCKPRFEVSELPKLVAFHHWCLWHHGTKRFSLLLAFFKSCLTSSLPFNMSNSTDDQPTDQSYNKTVVYTPQYPIDIPVDDCQKVRMYRLTSMYENSDIYLHFGYCDDIGDGHGYTSGIIGFCTATGAITIMCLMSVLMSPLLMSYCLLSRRCNPSYSSL